jgi:hypothetical protein
MQLQAQAHKMQLGLQEDHHQIQLQKMKWKFIMGSSWTEVNNLNTARRNSGASGTTTAGLLVAGHTAPSPPIANVESWDGTSWTEITDINTARKWT